jgi:16S rRNA C1402 (ribose-2'-O) methylase RsmI
VKEIIMAGMLYLCATPIGNLGDMTPRVVETLRQVDVIAAEDTRNSIKLLNHFEINTPMTSYHEYNKVEKAHQLILNTYKTLLTRGQKGCYVYCEDAALRDYIMTKLFPGKNS